MSKTNDTTTPAATDIAKSLLHTFQDLGMFASPDVRPDTIELSPGVTAAFYVRELPDAEFRKLWADGDRARLIAATICDADGNAIMSVDDAARLKPPVAAKFQDVALKHAGFGEKAAAAAEQAGNA
ncbi:hypothetical protein ACVQEN_06020 [Stenotrophomonas acidaminiphila]